MSLIQVSADLKILRHRQIDRQFTACKSATILAVAKVKQRKPVSGAYGGLPRTYTMLKREVMSEPTITRTTLQNKYLDLLKDVSIRAVQHIPNRRVAIKKEKNI